MALSRNRTNLLASYTHIWLHLKQTLALKQRITRYTPLILLLLTGNLRNLWLLFIKGPWL